MNSKQIFATFVVLAFAVAALPSTSADVGEFGTFAMQDEVDVVHNYAAASGIFGTSGVGGAPIAPTPITSDMSNAFGFVDIDGDGSYDTGENFYVHMAITGPGTGALSDPWATTCNPAGTPGAAPGACAGIGQVMNRVIAFDVRVTGFDDESGDDSYTQVLVTDDDFNSPAVVAGSPTLTNIDAGAAVPVANRLTFYDFDGDGVWSNDDWFYVDTDLSGRISAGDVRLAMDGGFLPSVEAGTRVQSTHQDENRVLTGATYAPFGSQNPTAAGSAAPGGWIDYFDADRSGRYTLGDIPYIDQDQQQPTPGVAPFVESEDIRLGFINMDTFVAGRTVKPADVDVVHLRRNVVCTPGATGAILPGFGAGPACAAHPAGAAAPAPGGILPPAAVIFGFVDANANGASDTGETVYLDMDMSGTVSAFDIRLTPFPDNGNPTYAAGTQVFVTDIDAGSAPGAPLTAIRGGATVTSPAFAGTPVAACAGGPAPPAVPRGTLAALTFYDSDGNSVWSTEDWVYVDVDGDGFVSPGDVRVTGNGVDAAGTRVQTNDLDETRPLILAPTRGAGCTGSIQVFDADNSRLNTATATAVGGLLYNGGDTVYFAQNAGTVTGRPHVEDLRFNMLGEQYGYGTFIEFDHTDVVYTFDVAPVPFAATRANAFAFNDENGNGAFDSTENMYFKPDGFLAAGLGGTGLAGCNRGAGATGAGYPAGGPLGGAGAPGVFLVCQFDVRVTPFDDESSGILAGSQVLSRDDDFQIPLIQEGMPTAIRLAFYDWDGDNTWSVDDHVYVDTDVDGRVSAGDVRLNAHDGFEAGSRVASGDIDESRRLIPSPAPLNGGPFAFYDVDRSGTPPGVAVVGVSGYNFGDLVYYSQTGACQPGSAAAVATPPSIRCAGLAPPASQNVLVEDFRLSGNERPSSSSGAGTPPTGGTGTAVGSGGNTGGGDGGNTGGDGGNTGGDGGNTGGDGGNTGGDGGNTGGDGGNTGGDGGNTGGDGTDNGDDDGAEQPGFELIALLAALGVALVLVRRRF